MLGVIGKMGVRVLPDESGDPRCAPRCIPYSLCHSCCLVVVVEWVHKLFDHICLDTLLKENRFVEACLMWMVVPMLTMAKRLQLMHWRELVEVQDWLLLQWCLLQTVVAPYACHIVSN